MDIRQIEQVLVVAMIGSINKAAPKLYMTQSNLSQSIRKVESECGHEIFIRTGAGVELTQFGRDFMRYAQDILKRYQQLELFCKDDQRPVNALSVSHHHLRFVNLVFIETYNKHADEHAYYSIKETSIKQVCEHVQHYQSELGFLPIISLDKHRMDLEFKERGLHYTELTTCSLGICFGQKSPLNDYQGSSISLSLLRNYPLVVYDDTISTFTDSISEIKLDQWPRIITVSDQATMNDVLQYTPAFTINSSLDIYQRVPYYGGLKRLELSDSDLMFSVGYIHNTKTPISPAAEDLLSAISGMLTPERTEIGAK